LKKLAKEQMIGTHELDLTGTEFQLLSLLMRHVGHLLSKEKLSEDILGRRLSAFDRSLDMHVSNLRKKLSQQGIENVIKNDAWIRLYI